ncbi:MAG TPA: HlyD family efflux transporter periplasmic adaptor subunit [Bacteroidales bacterium]|nr:HlyD family efflux transporter periplasmic adaptor subunit [Bacteroidales bacterium]HRR92612.1 HlyD family efflux transporter periplasmic adaptor subunit [Bacteroidales bacterium]HRT89530.1 HlyD family efflux transporter periplasmic adaptor subunit [Bacteroidales bacterium]
MKTEVQYSEPVTEIMGRPPGLITRVGTVVIFSVFVLFILFSWLIRYPDIVPAQVEITTENPPVTVMSRISGRIMHLLAGDREKVNAGQVLAVMENPAVYEDISRLRAFTDTFNVDPENFAGLPDLSGLGELQSSYETFGRSMADLVNFIGNDLYGARINALMNEISEIEMYIARLKESERLFRDNYNLELNRFRRDSLLNAGRTIPDAAYEQSRQALIRQQIELQKVRLDISARNIELTNKRQLIVEYNLQKKEENDKLLNAARESFKNLRADLSIWENNYLLVSPVNGVVTYSKYWSENQVVKKDEAVLSVVPEDPGKHIGKINLRMQKSGKVREGQTVMIKLSGYPYMEYGMLRGVIRSKSLVPSGDSYLIEILLENDLTTLYGKKLEFSQNMTGTGEIITDDMSLLEKMIYPFRYLASRNKRYSGG